MREVGEGVKLQMLENIFKSQLQIIFLNFFLRSDISGVANL